MGFFLEACSWFLDIYIMLCVSVLDGFLAKGSSASLDEHRLKL